MAHMAGQPSARWVLMDVLWSALVSCRLNPVPLTKVLEHSGFHHGSFITHVIVTPPQAGPVPVRGRACSCAPAGAAQAGRLGPGLPVRAQP